MIKFRHILALISVGCVLLLSGCHMALLDPKGVIAAGEKSLLIDATLLMLIVVIPVIFINFFFAWRYRASNEKATYRPDDGHNTIIESICWLIPCLIITVLAVMTWISSHELDPYRPLDTTNKPITIQVISLNWKWLFIYPDENIATINYIQIPVNTQVRFLISSDGPMNSFQIPQLAGQIYAMSGMQTKLHIMATAEGDYDGMSTNISGNGFSGMTFTVHVGTQAEYSAWVNTVHKSPDKLTLPVYNQLVAPTENDPVRYFSSVEPDLFNNVIMKFMMPMPKYALAIDGSQ